MTQTNQNVPLEDQPASKPSGLRGLLRQRETGIALAALAMLIGLSLFAHNFATSENLLNVIKNLALLGIVATGMTFLFVAGELDLSVGSMYILLTMLLAYMIVNLSLPIPLAIFLTFVLGGLFGLLNGLVTTQLKIPAFITTLGTMLMFGGSSLLLNDGIQIIGIKSPTYKSLMAADVFGFLPAQVFWMLGIMLIGGLVLAKTKFGYQVYAVGGNRQAAENVGINVNRIKILCFTATGVLVAMSSIIAVGWFGSASPSQNTGFELDIIAAVIIGGTTLYGGSGTIFGTFLGAAIFGMIGNGLVLLGVNSYGEPIVKGIVIVLAVALDGFIRTRQAQAAKGSVLAKMRQQKK
jgi:ribose transport system permease protein